MFLSHRAGSTVKLCIRANWDVIVVVARLTAGATAASGGADTVVLGAHQLGRRARPVTKEPHVFNIELGVQTVHSASVGDMRAARRAGRRPATAPMIRAAASPPAQASAGTTMAHPLVVA
jgi:hypothetical protein